MSDEQPKPDPAVPPRTFSLGTMFLFVTCFGIVCAGTRIEGAKDGLFSSLALVFGFLTVWFFVTGRHRGSRNSFIALVAIVLIWAFAVPINSDVGPRRLVTPSGNLRQIGLALCLYHEKYGSFPPAYVADANGKPLSSWRVALLPFIDRKPIYQSFHLDQPWNSSANNKLSQISLDIYQCPPDQSGPAMTEYVAVVGPNTAWPGANGSKLADFKDPSKTILVVETANAGIHWAEPRDLYVGQMAAGVNPKKGQGISSQRQGGAWAVFADSHVEFVPADIDPQELARMLEINPADETGK